MSCSHSIAEVQAIQEVEYLRRRYARATDLIGTATPEAIAEGRAIYHAVFAADAKQSKTRQRRSDRARCVARPCVDCLETSGTYTALDWHSVSPDQIT